MVDTDQKHKDSARKTIIRDSLVFSAGLIINYFFSLLGSLLTAKFVQTADYGFFKRIQIYMQYGSYTNLGINNAVSKLSPSLYSTDRKDEFNRMIHNALRIGMFIPALMLISAIALKMLYIKSEETTFYLVFAILMFFAQLYDLSEISMASMKKFTLKGKLNAVFAVARVGLLVGAAYFYSLKGLIIAFIFITMATALIESLIVKISFINKFDRQMFIDLFKHSLPVTVMQLAETFFMTSDRFLVSLCLGDEEFGVYSLGLIVAPFILMIPSGIRQVISINVYDEYGKTEKISGMEKYYTHSVLILSHLVPITGALCYYFIPFVIRNFLPNYIRGIEVLQLYILLSLFICIVQTSQSVLIVMSKEKISVYAHLLFTSVNVSASLWIIAIGGKGYDVLLAHFPGMICYGLFVFFFVLVKFGHTKKQLIHEFVSTYLPLAWFYITIFFTTLCTKYLLVRYNVSIQYLINGITLTLLNLPILYRLDKRSPILRDIINMLRQKFFPTV